MADTNKKPNTASGKGQKKAGTENTRKRTASDPANRSAAPRKKTASSSGGTKKTGSTPEKKSSGTGERRQTGSAAARKREAQVKEQKEKLIKICIIVGIILFVIILAAALPKRNREEEPVSEESAVSEVVDVPTTERPFSDIRHLSFGPLSVDASGRTLTVAEFVQILNELYADGYVLIDPECITPAFGKNTVSVPEGKKPLIISQRDVSYSFLRQGSSYAQRLVLDSQGNVTCQYADRSGNVTYGDYDLIPALESFIKTHPDFSYNNARGLIGLTGDMGILGYRTTTYLGGTENNPYAELYGTFDPSTETSKASTVVRALKMRNWRFACCGFASDISYGSETAIVAADATEWVNEVGSIVGDCSFMIFPNSTDIGGWEVYTDSNQKYVSLTGLGFSVFFSVSDTPGIVQKTDNYVREGIYLVNHYDDYTAARARG